MSLQVLLNLTQAQDAAQVDGDKLPWTPARLRSHPTVSLLLGGKGSNRVKRYDAGYEIREKFDGKVETDFGPAAMGSDYEWNSTGEMAFMSRPYREYRWSESIFRHEIAFQGGAYSSGSHSRALWQILDKKNLNFDLGPIDKLERDYLWRTPDAAMEDKGTQAAPIVSIPSIVNEWNATVDGSIAGDGLPPGFTTQQDLDPDDYSDPNTSVDTNTSLAACRRIPYLGTANASGVTGSGNTTVAAGHLLERMSLACRLTKYDTVPMVGQAAASGMLPAIRAILCTEEGYTYMEQVIRAAGGDLFHIIGPGKSAVTFNDFPLLPVPALSGAALYPAYDATATDFVSEGDTDGHVGPRFYFLNNDSLDLFCHSEGYFDITNWYSLDQINPDKIVKHGRCWWNLFARDFRTNAIVFPNDNQTDFVGV